ncbi:MAG: CGNR zinc finger domain-containing protein [Gordonia sp. (in: high G+C Gram-positive bacteria)]|uniref:CGNR zinc finger domain-containing protein n=1 Tax=Gordonia sp. (in: high G+C Gram-positive bacteria) TaxID=84139 RepID=UPI0039E2E5B9
MRTQYVSEGVLVRPFELPSTNFLSSRYYDGRAIVDQLDAPAAAHHWMRVLHREIAFPAVPFSPSDEQLSGLRALRDTVEDAYRATVADEIHGTADGLRDALAGLRITPALTASDGRLVATWSPRPQDPFEELTAEILLSAVRAVASHDATRLNRCHAPRCVLYFTRRNSRQHWCSDVCGNRARVARATRAAATESS